MAIVKLTSTALLVELGSGKLLGLLWLMVKRCWWGCWGCLTPPLLYPFIPPTILGREDCLTIPLPDNWLLEVTGLVSTPLTWLPPGTKKRMKNKKIKSIMYINYRRTFSTHWLISIQKRLRNYSKNSSSGFKVILFADNFRRSGSVKVEI